MLILQERKGAFAAVPLSVQYTHHSAKEREENRPVGIKTGVGGTRGEPTKVDNIEHYPYFTNFVRDIFEQNLAATAMVCKTKCLEEFHSPDTVYWASQQCVLSLHSSPLTHCSNPMQEF